MIDFITGLICIFSLLMSVLVLFFFIKNDNTLKNQCIIIDAIFEYKMDYIHNNQECLVDYSDQESYVSTLLRFWDWGYKNILPKEKYEIIKPYIK